MSIARNILILLFLVSLSTGADDLTSRIVGFNRHWVQFCVRYWGCESAQAKDCRDERQQIDYSEFQSSRKAAMDLFNLEEKK